MVFVIIAPNDVELCPDHFDNETTIRFISITGLCLLAILFEDSKSNTTLSGGNADHMLSFYKLSRVSLFIVRQHDLDSFVSVVVYMSIMLSHLKLSIEYYKLQFVNYTYT